LTQSKVSAPGGDAGEHVVGLGDAQQVARLVLGQRLGDPADDRAEVLLLQRAADAVPVEATCPRPRAPASPVAA
jgi:hypothetical protein